MVMRMVMMVVAVDSDSGCDYGDNTGGDCGAVVGLVI